MYSYVFSVTRVDFILQALELKRGSRAVYSTSQKFEHPFSLKREWENVSKLLANTVYLKHVDIQVGRLTFELSKGRKKRVAWYINTIKQSLYSYF